MPAVEPPSFDSKAFLAGVSQRPGVYQMLDETGGVLYVGKAKNLKNRLSSYFRDSGLPIKTRALVARIRDVQVTITNSETEALLLEHNLIKRERPPYNILLRDDKSYPYIFVSDAERFPALQFQRGGRRRKGRYFGPFPSSGAVRESLNLLQKVFRIRQCDEAFFRNRSRPCLQFQIDRCSGPCTGEISPQAYAEDVRHAMMFLEGRSQTLRDELAQQMDAAAKALDFEKAAVLRDQITSLQQVQEQQHVSGLSGDADILACCQKAGFACIHQIFVKGGRIIGSKTHYPKLALEVSEADLLAGFLGQYYLQSEARPVPPQIVLSHEPAASESLREAMVQARGRQVAFLTRVRGQRRGWLQLAQTNAQQQLDSYIGNRQNMHRRFVALQDALGLDAPPRRLECFDISHSSGEAPVASCVVFDTQGPRKTDYRRFNVDGVTPGDDYAAMRTALRRRYTRLKKGEGQLPDILVIDGGKGQLTQAEQVFEELQVDDVLLLGIAKGVTRKPGLETLIMGGDHREEVLTADSGALHLLQHIRDEAHRFAVAGHRQRRAKKRGSSLLESIPGVGPKRRQALLKHFGGWQEIGRASIEEIAKVSTISRSMAEEIYAHLHQE
ncbi:excinuclease ABC subunit UvrC [Motiliproteus sp. SC1-56]|uniref:excinuclease ABC subunit UvrC n=1 Tax=Motiliproteus sp. SC1-56 TaxID=2799565 RepID=UPI001A90A0D5|nr:excinuclease ABC subunit UvrC [Motiliproteus sp. SC1-56]